MKYKISNECFSVVEITLDKGESISCDVGAMSWKTDGIKMTTRSGELLKSLSRKVAGETFFQNIYYAERAGIIALSPSVLGTIMPVKINPNQSLIIQKRAMLASEPTVESTITVQKNILHGLFGGEGFILSRLYGHGLAFLEVDGVAYKYHLNAGEGMEISTSSFFAMTGGCSLKILPVKGVKNAIFGGEGLVNSYVEGPGYVFVQSTPSEKYFRNIMSAIEARKR